MQLGEVQSSILTGPTFFGIYLYTNMNHISTYIYIILIGLRSSIGRTCTLRMYIKHRTRSGIDTWRSHSFYYYFIAMKLLCTNHNIYIILIRLCSSMVEHVFLNAKVQSSIPGGVKLLFIK